MDGIPPVPSRPRNTLRLTDTNKRQTFHPDSNSNVLKVPAASPEVMASLISSLSAISTPAETLFDSLLPGQAPHSAPATPTSHSFRGHAGAPFTSDRFPKSLSGNGFLHPDDAAISPVIRTSKPPSGFSPLTAPKKSSAALGSSMRHSHSAQEPDSSYSIGNLSVEPGPRRSSASMSIDSGERILKAKASKEKMREIDKERKRKMKHNTIEGSRSPVKSFRDGIEVPPESPKLGQLGLGEAFHLEPPVTPSRTSTNPTLLSVDSQLRPLDEYAGSAPSPGSPDGIGGARSIPARESSLKYGSTSSKGRRQRKSYKASHVPSEVHIEEPSEDTAEEEAQQELLLEPQDVESVARRIKELKRQKEIRERSHSDDEGQSQRDSQWDSRKKSIPARSSLPAPSTKPAVNSSESQVKLQSSTAIGDTFKEKEGSSASSSQLKSAPEVNPALGKHGRAFSNPLSPPRKSTQVDDRLSLADSIDDAVDDYLAAPRLSHKIYHPQTGRAISFSDVGDPEGSAIFCCVGMGTTRYLTAFYDELACSLKLRLITPDRPGIGDSQPHADGLDTPLGWPDDIRAICQHLGISRFSILAHSAGSIYALATALRMPQHIRGRIHLLAPWIPPSQMVSIGINQERVPVTTLPYSQRMLRSLPTPFLKAANSRFFSVTSSSIASIQKSPRRNKRRSLTVEALDPSAPPKPARDAGRPSLMLDGSNDYPALRSSDLAAGADYQPAGPPPMRMTEKERQTEYDIRLTQAIWDAATTNANPAVDLLVCLERRQEIGFRYVDIAKSVVIHHGSKDTRVPVENIKWLANMMRSCEVRVLEREGHGLMASATVMSSVLTEMAKEWEDWNAVTRSKRAANKR